MIYAIDNQMRQAWTANGKRAVDLKVHLHPKTLQDHIKRYWIDSLCYPERMVSRFGNIYFIADESVGEGLAVLQFVRKARSDRPEDI